MGSFRIATVRGIPIKIHWTFFILPLFYGLGAGSTSGAIRGVVFIMLLFACVVLHELGHSLAAQHYGIPVKEILLLPLGGLAQITRMPRRPWHEFVIAIAGPSVNIIIVLLLTLLSPSLLDLRRLTQQAVALAGVDLLRDLMLTNLYLAAFNMLPAFPMDGGRVLRALLHMALPLTTATTIASWIGRLFAVAFAALGLFAGNWMLVLISVFIFFGANAENIMVQEDARWRALRAADFLRPAATLHPSDLLGYIEPMLRASAQPLYPVVDGPRLEGMVGRDELLRALYEFGPATPVGAVISPAHYISSDLPLQNLYRILQQRGLPGLLVIDDHRLLGVVAARDVAAAMRETP